jgi:phage baseplate assembly protein gpV
MKSFIVLLSAVAIMALAGNIEAAPKAKAHKTTTVHSAAYSGAKFAYKWTGAKAAVHGFVFAVKHL